MRRIGIDVGGTFTDIVLHDDTSGEVWSTKVPSTPSDPSVGALNGLNRILGPEQDRARPCGLHRPRHNHRDQHGDRGQGREDRL